MLTQTRSIAFDREHFVFDWCCCRVRHVRTNEKAVQLHNFIRYKSFYFIFNFEFSYLSIEWQWQQPDEMVAAHWHSKSIALSAIITNNRGRHTNTRRDTKEEMKCAVRVYVRPSASNVSSSTSSSSTLFSSMKTRNQTTHPRKGEREREASFNFGLKWSGLREKLKEWKSNRSLNTC